MDKKEGPYIVWQNHGYEGWEPSRFETLKAALESQKYATEWIITKDVQYEVTEMPEP